MSTIYRPLIGVYEYLTKNLNGLSDYRDVGFFGQYTTVVNCLVEVVFKDNGEVRAAILPEPVKSLQFNKGRTNNACPFLFCDKLSYFFEKKKFDVYEKACKKIFEDKELPKSVQCWLNALPKVGDALRAINLKQVKDSENIVFRYNGEATPLIEREEVFALMTANDCALRHEWFEMFSNKKSKKVDDFLVWYDVIDDKPLTLDEIHLSRPGCTLFGTPNVRIATFNDKYNDMNPINSDYSALNFPMSKKHGSIIDAVLDWLARYKYGNRKPFIFKFIDECDEKSKKQNPSSLRKFLWFPNLDVCENLDFEDFVTKTSIMPSRMISLLRGRLPEGVSFDEEGNVLSDNENCPLEWLTDDGIMLYEIIQENRRCNFVERPFSLNALIRKICKYNATNVKCGGNENHRNDFYRAFYETYNSDYLWKQYVNNHIVGGGTAPKEMLNRIRKFLLHGREKVYNQSTITAKELRALITELVKQHNSSFDEIINSPAFASGKWCNNMSYSQYNLGLPQSFGKDHMQAVYNGKTTIAKEIKNYLTINEEHAKRLRLMCAKKRNVIRESRYYTPSTPFGTSLYALHHRNESKDINSSDEQSCVEMFIGGLKKTEKELHDAAPITTESEKNAFLVGFYLAFLQNIEKSLDLNQKHDIIHLPKQSIGIQKQ